MKRHVAYIVGQGFEWLEDPKHVAAIIRNRSKMGAKPQSSPGSKDVGKTDPEALDELEDMEAKLYQQDTGISIYMSSGRFDMQLCVKRLSEMMMKPRKMGNLRLARLARCLVGTQMLTLRFDHQEYGDTENSPRLRDWAGSEERYSTHAGLEFHGGHLVDSWVASDQVRALSSGGKQNSTESWMVLHEEPSQITCTKKWDETSISTSKRTRRQRLECVLELALERPDTNKFVGCGSKMPYVTKLFA